MTKKNSFKVIFSKCYIDGDTYYNDEKGFKKYNDDLISHLDDGSWSMAMTVGTLEFNHYLYNYREMNNRFVPSALNRVDKSDIKWSAKKSNLLSKLMVVKK